MSANDHRQQKITINMSPPQSLTPVEKQRVRMEILAVRILEVGLRRLRWTATDRDVIADLVEEGFDAEAVARGYERPSVVRKRSKK